MSFLYPAFLLGALAVAVPIVLHLLRRGRAPEVPFTAVRLLKRTPSGERSRRRLRDPLLLAARIAALGLLALAFARPFVTASGAGEPLRIVAIDRSYSMGAAGQFARALAAAREIVAAAPRSARMAVIAFDDRADVLAEPGPAIAAAAALEGLEPGYGGTRFGSLLARAAEIAADGPAHLDIITDMQRAGWEGSEPHALPAHLRVRLHSLDRPPSNAAVTAVRRTDDGVLASVEQAGDAPLETIVRLLLDGQPLAERPVTVPAGGTVEVRFRDELPQQGAVAVEIDDPAGFPADDIRHLVLDPSPPSRLLVIAEAGGAGFFLTRALEAAGDPVSVRHATAVRLGQLGADEWQDTDAVALLTTRGLDRRGRDALVRFVEAGGGLLVAAGGDLDAAVLGSVMGWADFEAADVSRAPATLAVTDLRHPIFQPFGSLVANIGDVRFERAWDIRGAGWEVVARFSTGSPAVLERRQERGRIVLFASDLDRRWNDFPLHATFVPFAIEAVRHVAGRAVAARAYVVADAPAGVEPRPGVHTRPADGRRVAVDVDLQERWPAAMTRDEFMSMVEVERQESASVTRAAVEDVEARQGLWRYAILVMLGLLLIESFMGRPR